MDFSSLPQFPSAFRLAAPAHALRKLPSPRLTRALLGLGVLSAAGLSLYALWPNVAAMIQRPTPAPTAPLDFRIIQQRYDDMPLSATPEEVRWQLGPPSSEDDPGIESVEVMIEYHPDRYPGHVETRYWLKWADPNDQDKWVRVLMVDGKVLFKYKHGF